jgi:hypothetical protein
MRFGKSETHSMTSRRPVPGTQVQSASDLLHLWEGLVGSEGFDCRSIWVVLLDSDRQTLPFLMPIDNLPLVPNPADVGKFLGLVDLLMAELSADSAVMLLSRPGGAAMTDRDRRWAAALRDAGTEPMRRWPMHLATRDRITVFAPDDVIGVGSSSGVRTR